MKKAFKDYYETFKGDAEGIDPSLGREDNYERFKRASSRYSQMHGKDVELSMVKAALGIFRDEAKYTEYRKNYVRYKLEGFINGAIEKEDNSLLRSKYNSLLEDATENGIFKAEVDALLELSNIKIKNDPYNKTNQGEKPKKLGIVAILGIIFIVALIGLGLYKYTPFFTKQSHPAATDGIRSDTSTIDFAQAIGFLALKPPEYSKIEDAVKAFRANISQPGAKEGLIKAADIYLKWGDDTPNLEESRSMYQKALECSSAADGNRTEEIKSKLKELAQ